MNGPLAGIKVLDLSRVLAGPWCTQALADFGADVLKIEKPDGGDDTRAWGPPFLSNPDGSDSAESAYFLSCNRGKRSVAIDLGSADGQATIRALAAKADVLVENFKVGGLKKYGLDYASLRERCPRLIYCSITGFGQSGPYADRAGYDAMIQGIGGIMSITGVPDGEPGAGPQKIGVAAADLMTGMYALSGILAALHARSASGQGQHIDIALLDTQVAWLANQGMNYLVGGQAPTRLGTAHPNIVPYQVFAAADGHLMLAVGNDSQFAKFCAVAGQPSLATDVRFASNASRVEHRAALVAIVAALIHARPLDEWLERLSAVGVPCGPINTLDRVFADPQVQHRGVVRTLDHRLGLIPTISNPLKFSATPLKPERPPPMLGQHTAEALADWL
jgi:crotonobetainyl-CoA:carnitine CoA-transferase CaiB-like acyl-CoA transferase